MNTKKDKKLTPEKIITDYGVSKIRKILPFLLVLLAYWQAYEYISESPKITVYLKKSQKIAKKHKTYFSIRNGSEAIMSNDVVSPLVIHLDNKIDSLVAFKSVTKPNFEINSKSVILNFELLNKNEDFIFIIYTRDRPYIKSVDYRIKNIESVDFFDFETIPPPLNRVFNIWLILLLFSVVLFIDALIVLTKDIGLQDIYNYISQFPLNQNNKKKFVQGYKQVYRKYRLRIKPGTNLMGDIIDNQFKVFTLETPQKVKIFKSWTLLKTDLLTLYRVRTAFIFISPIAFLISILALILNYFYYEIEAINQLLSLEGINKIGLTIIVVGVLISIVIPRKMMNLLFVKKKDRPVF